MQSPKRLIPTKHNTPEPVRSTKMMTILGDNNVSPNNKINVFMSQKKVKTPFKHLDFDDNSFIMDSDFSDSEFEEEE